MTRLVFGHFVNGVVNRVEVEFFGKRGKIFFALAGTVLGGDADFEIFFGGCADDFAQKFGELGGVFGLFKRVTTESLADFGITFAVCGAAHCQVHADFGAFARKVLAQTFDDFFVDAFGNADDMFVREDQLAALLNEFFGGCLANRAFDRRGVTLVDVAADTANIFRHGENLPNIIFDSYAWTNYSTEVFVWEDFFFRNQKDPA